MNKPQETKASNFGTVASVRGSVVDAHFPKKLPLVYTLLKAGEDGEIAVEVQVHLNSEVVRGVALTPTQGLAAHAGGAAQKSRAIPRSPTPLMRSVLLEFRDVVLDLRMMLPMPGPWV